MNSRRQLWIAVLAIASLAMLGLCVLGPSGQLALSMLFSPAIAPAPENWQDLPVDQRLADLKARRLSHLQKELRAACFNIGNPAFIRTLKESSEFELWLQKTGTPTFAKFKTYPVARWSGSLGPKQQEGDGQTPEGFYAVTREGLNPGSRYHLSFNIGYPNDHDIAWGRSGSLIMVHGKDVSIGCFAMTDPVMEEIYLIVEAALQAGQNEVPVHCFPFRMTEARLAQARTENHPWAEFWSSLHPMWLAFEREHIPPHICQDLEYSLEN